MLQIQKLLHLLRLVLDLGIATSVPGFRCPSSRYDEKLLRLYQNLQVVAHRVPLRRSSGCSVGDAVLIRNVSNRFEQIIPAGIDLCRHEGANAEVCLIVCARRGCRSERGVRCGWGCIGTACQKNIKTQNKQQNNNPNKHTRKQKTKDPTRKYNG